MSIYQATLVGESPGPNALRNIHHYEFPGYVPTAAELQEFVDGLATAYAGVIAHMADDITLSSFEVRRVDVGDLPTEEITPDGWPVTGGSAASAMLPPQVAALVTWKAPTTFPRSTRTYLFPFAASVLSPTGTIALAARTAMEVFAADLEEIEVTGQVDAQKVAVQYGGDPRAVVASNIVFATPIDSVFATQRSRRYGVGE